MKILLTFFVLFFSSSVFAEWVFLEKNSGGYDFYYNDKLIYKDKDHIYFWQLSNFPSIDVSGDMSSIFYTQLNCTTKKYKWLYLKFYDQQMGMGKINAEFPSDEWQTNPPNSVGSFIDNYICDNYR
tara:strand:+ start:733 stop:1110 length:378 start_codon:yes stop_codon:yes gene_type:complete